MPLVSTASIVDPAHRNGQGVAAFNVITLEHAEAIAAGAERAGQPAILQISENAVRFHQGRLGPLAAAVVAVASESLRPWPFTSTTSRTRRSCARRPAPASARSCSTRQSSTTQANVAATRAAAQWAHEHGIWIEAELGEIGGKDGAHAPGVRTDPGEAPAVRGSHPGRRARRRRGQLPRHGRPHRGPGHRLIHDLARRLAGPAGAARILRCA